MPTTAETSPTGRMRPRPGSARPSSGARTKLGKAANSRPSTAKTRPTPPEVRHGARQPGAGRPEPAQSAAGVAAAAGPWPASPPDRRSSGRTRGPATAPGACRPFFSAGLVGLHRPPEGEEARDRGRRPPPGCGCVSASPLPRSSSARRVASARSTVTSRSASRLDGLRELRAVGADVRRLALALRLHALEHRLAVLLRQVGAAQPHVHHLDAEARRPGGSRRRGCGASARRGPCAPPR